MAFRFISQMKNYLMLGYFAFNALLTFPLVNGQGNPLLFLGPGRSNGESEVFTLPNAESPMTNSSCTVPSYASNIQGAVAFVTPEGLEVCGGSNAAITYDCYSLKDSQWVASTPMMVQRAWAAAAKLKSGDILVTGGWDDSTGTSTRIQSSELLTGSSWKPALDLPSGRSGHCLLQLSSGQLFLHGGRTAAATAGDTYISADLTSWTTRVSSNTPRSYHACTEVTNNNDQQVWLGGGYNVGTSEIYNVAQDGFTSGPDLPNYSLFPGVLVAYGGNLYYAGGYLNTNIYQLKEGWTQQDAWTKIGEMSHGRYVFPALIINLEACKGIKPTPTPLKLSSITWSGQCVIDDPNRLLDHQHRMGTTNTPQVCIDYCASNGYAFAGVQAWDWCLCGQTSPPTSVIKPEGECHQNCPGDNTKFCGAPWRMNVYETTPEITSQCGTLKKKRSLASCEVWENINIPGNDLNIDTVNEDDRDTWQECRELCNERPECNFFEWQHKVSSGVVVNHCWIKSGISEKVPRADHVSGPPCRGIEPTPTPLEVSYNHDGSVGYVSGTLAPIVTELASGSTESHDVRCCGGVYGNTTTTKCGNGTSCTNICGSKNSGCVTLICDECHTSSPDHQVCDEPMQDKQWCANAETIQEITSQCGTLKRKRPLQTSIAAPGVTTTIMNINYCPWKCHTLDALGRMPLCCLHPYVKRAVKGASQYCCNQHKLCV